MNRNAASGRSPVSNPPSPCLLRGVGRWLCALALAGLLVGCKTSHQLYSGSPRPPSEIAILKGGVEQDRDYIRVEQVDGKPGPNKWAGGSVPPVYNSRLHGRYFIELEPGVHTVVVNWSFSAERKTVGFEAKAGKAYTIKARFAGKEWTAEAEEVLK